MSKLYTPVTYEYMCKDCSEVVETRRAPDDRDKPVKCDECGGRAIRKFSTFGFKI